MPDLQSELAKVWEQANFDDEPGANEPPAVIDTTTPTATPPGRPIQEKSKRRAVWDYIRANAHSSVSEVSDSLQIDQNFCYATMHALHNAGRLSRKKVDDVYKYSVISDNYEDRLVMKPMKKAKKAKKVAKDVKPLAQIKRDLGLPPTPAPAPTPKAFNADEIIGQLNVMQARELLVRLKEVFGV